MSRFINPGSVHTDKTRVDDMRSAIYPVFAPVIQLHSDFASESEVNLHHKTKGDMVKNESSGFISIADIDVEIGDEVSPHNTSFIDVSFSEGLLEAKRMTYYQTKSNCVVVADQLETANVIYVDGGFYVDADCKVFIVPGLASMHKFYKKGEIQLEGWSPEIFPVITSEDSTVRILEDKVTVESLSRNDVTILQNMSDFGYFVSRGSSVNIIEQAAMTDNSLLVTEPYIKMTKIGRVKFLPDGGIVASKDVERSIISGSASGVVTTGSVVVKTESSNILVKTSGNTMDGVSDVFIVNSIMPVADRLYPSHLDPVYKFAADKNKTLIKNPHITFKMSGDLEYSDYKYVGAIFNTDSWSVSPETIVWGRMCETSARFNFSIPNGAKWISVECDAEAVSGDEDTGIVIDVDGVESSPVLGVGNHVTGDKTPLQSVSVYSANGCYVNSTTPGWFNWNRAVLHQIDGNIHNVYGVVYPDKEAPSSSSVRVDSPLSTSSGNWYISHDVSMKERRVYSASIVSDGAFVSKFTDVSGKSSVEVKVRFTTEVESFRIYSIRLRVA